MGSLSAPPASGETEARAKGSEAFSEIADRFIRNAAVPRA